jgi:hypothetical protein
MFPDPVVSRLGAARRVLVAGCGGGYDVLGAVPLVAALEARGVDVHLASLSFCYLSGLAGAVQDADHPNLYEVGADAVSAVAYCPEAWLARFLEARRGGRRSIWCLDKTGVAPLAAAYRALVARLGVDAIVLVDGGIDALLRGDETSLGTPSEDLASLAAVASLDEVPVRLLACVGLGAELRDGIPHAQVLERIAELTRLGGFLGASSLVAGAAETDLYLDAVADVFANQAAIKQSHVHAVITAACRGEFGSGRPAAADVDAPAPHVWLNPLMALFWFFDATTVAASHLFLRELAGTESIWEVGARIEGIRKGLPIKRRGAIPL